MLFSKPPLYITRKRNSILIYNGKDAVEFATIEIPKDVEKNEEILNLTKFQDLIESSLKNHISKGQKVIILLSDEIIFQKKIQISDNRPQEEQIQSFLEDVPFDTAKIAQLQIQTQEGLLLVATNCNLYAPIVTSLIKIGASAQAVLPISLFGEEKVSQELISNINKNSQLAKRGNLLNVQAGKKAQIKSQEKAEPKVETKKESAGNDKKQTKLLILAAALIVTGVVFIIYYVSTQFLFKKQSTAPAPVVDIDQAPIVDNKASETSLPSEASESTATP